MPAEAAERARAKARRKASKRQRQLKEQTLFLAGWLLVFCSLPATRWADAQVLALYRARWQIELLIKRMKSVLKLAQLRGKTALTNEAAILAAGSVSASQDTAVAQPAALEPREAVISSWLLTTLCVQGSWTPARLRICLPHLRRFVCESPRRRQQQERTIRRQLMSHLAGAGPDSSCVLFCSSA